MYIPRNLSLWVLFGEESDFEYKNDEKLYPEVKKFAGPLAQCVSDNGPLNPSTHQLIDSTHQPINPSTHRLIDQPIIDSTHRLIDESINVLMYQCIEPFFDNL